MASITIRKLDDHTKERLRVRAASHRRSMEDEARNILRAAVAQPDTRRTNLAEAIRRRFKGLDTSDVEIPAREPMRPPPKPISRRR